MTKNQRDPSKEAGSPGGHTVTAEERALELRHKQALERSAALKALAGGAVALALGIAAMFKFRSLDAGVERTLLYVGLIAVGVYAILWGVRSLITSALGGRSEAEAERDYSAIPLVHSRYRHLTWMVSNLVLGVLLLLKFGSFGTVVGTILVAWAALHAWRFSLTVMTPAGEFRVRDGKVTLPSGLCKKRALEVAVGDISHVYFLRRAAPWNLTAPVLVVETAEESLAYPRDWFATDADQIAALQLLSGHDPEAQAAKPRTSGKARKSKA